VARQIVERFAERSGRDQLIAIERRNHWRLEASSTASKMRT
jgi:hypothetical protein